MGSCAALDEALLSRGTILRCPHMLRSFEVPVEGPLLGKNTVHFQLRLILYIVLLMQRFEAASTLEVAGRPRNGFWQDAPT